MFSVNFLSYYILLAANIYLDRLYIRSTNALMTIDFSSLINIQMILMAFKSTIGSADSVGWQVYQSESRRGFALGVNYFLLAPKFR